MSRPPHFSRAEPYPSTYGGRRPAAGSTPRPNHHRRETTGAPRPYSDWNGRRSYPRLSFPRSFAPASPPSTATASSMSRTDRCRAEGGDGSTASAAPRVSHRSQSASRWDKGPHDSPVPLRDMSNTNRNSGVPSDRPSSALVDDETLRHGTEDKRSHFSSYSNATSGCKRYRDEEAEAANFERRRDLIESTISSVRQILETGQKALAKDSPDQGWKSPAKRINMPLTPITTTRERGQGGDRGGIKIWGSGSTCKAEETSSNDRGHVQVCARQDDAETCSIQTALTTPSPEAPFRVQTAAASSKENISTPRSWRPSLMSAPVELLRLCSLLSENSSNAEASPSKGAGSELEAFRDLRDLFKNLSDVGDKEKALDRLIDCCRTLPKVDHQAVIEYTWDLCEADSRKERLLGYSRLFSLSKNCNDSETTHRNVDVVCQLLVTESSTERSALFVCLEDHLFSEPDVTLSIIFEDHMQLFPRQGGSRWGGPYLNFVRQLFSTKERTRDIDTSLRTKIVERLLQQLTLAVVGASVDAWVAVTNELVEMNALWQGKEPQDVETRQKVMNAAFTMFFPLSVPQLTIDETSHDLEPQLQRTFVRRTTQERLIDRSLGADMGIDPSSEERGSVDCQHTLALARVLANDSTSLGKYPLRQMLTRRQQLVVLKALAETSCSDGFKDSLDWKRLGESLLRELEHPFLVGGGFGREIEGKSEYRGTRDDTDIDWALVEALLFASTTVVPPKRFRAFGDGGVPVDEYSGKETHYCLKRLYDRSQMVLSRVKERRQEQGATPLLTELESVQANNVYALTKNLLRPPSFREGIDIQPSWSSPSASLSGPTAMAIKRKAEDSEEGEISRKGEAEHSASKRPRRDVPQREVKSFSQKSITNSKGEESWSDSKRLQASGRPDFCSAKLDYETQRQGGLPKYGPPPTSWSSSPPRIFPLHQTIESASSRLSKSSSRFQEDSWTRSYTKGSSSMSTLDYSRIPATSQQHYNEGARWHHRRPSPPSLPLHQRLSPTQQRGSREAPDDRESFWRRGGGMIEGSGSQSRYGDGSSGRERHEYRRARRE